MTLCPHRGHVMAEGRCPYHGLCLPVGKDSFAKPGRTISAASSPFPPFDDSAMDTLCDDMGPMFSSNDMLVAAPWFLWMQNTMDFNHLKTVHKTFGSQFDPDAVPCDIHVSEDWKDSSYRIPVRKDVHKSYERICGKSLPPYFFHATNFPALSVTSFLNVFYSVETVKDVDGATMVSTKFFESARNRLPKSLLNQAAKSNLALLLEDKAIMESWATTYHLRRDKNWLPHEQRIQIFCAVLEREYGPTPTP